MHLKFFKDVMQIGKLKLLCRSHTKNGFHMRALKEVTYLCGGGDEKKERKKKNQHPDGLTNNGQI